MDHLEDQIAQVEGQLRRAREREDDEARRALSQQLQDLRSAVEEGRTLSQLRTRTGALRRQIGDLDMSGRPVAEVQATAKQIRDQIAQIEREAGQVSVARRSPLAGEARHLTGELETLRADFRAGMSVGRTTMGGSLDSPSGPTLRAWRLDMGMSQSQFARYLQENAPPPPPDHGRPVNWSQQRISRLEANPGILGPRDRVAYVALTGTGDPTKDAAGERPLWQRKPFSEQQRLERQGERIAGEARVWADIQTKIAAGQALDRREVADVIQSRNLDVGTAATGAGIERSRLEAYLSGRGTLNETELAAVNRLAGKENWSDPTRAPGQGRHAAAEGIYPQTIRTIIATDGSVIHLVAHNAAERRQINQQLGGLMADRGGRRLESFTVGYAADGTPIKKEVDAKTVQDSVKLLQAAGGQLTGKIRDYYFNS